MAPPKVTIAIPTYNRAALVGRAVTSVLTQTYAGEIECVIVDDGSTDETEAALSQIRGALTHYYRHKVNRGIAYSKNLGLILGSGELRGILDSDDWYEPEFVARCVAELEQRPDVVAVYTDNSRATPEGKRVATEPAGDWSMETLLGCKLRGDCYLARWAALERTQLHDELFQLEVDYDLFYGLAALGPLARIPVPLQTVTQHDGRTTQDRVAAAYWHAAGLGKWGQSVRWALQRAQGHDDWQQAISHGYAFGQSIAYRRQLKRILRGDDNTVERWRGEWRTAGRGRLDTTLLTDVLAWLPERCRFLDLGCGDGTLTTAIRAARPEAHGIGVDFALPPERTGEAWVAWDLRTEPLPGPEHAFDVVLCTEVLEHLQDPLRVFQVARRLVAPRGHLLLSTPLGDDIKDSFHLWALRPMDVIAMAETAGGRVLHMAKAGEFGRRAVLYVVGWADA